MSETDNANAPNVDSDAFRSVVKFVAIANLAYFVVEFIVAVNIGSVSLFADSIDFLEDASVNLLILLAIGWSLKARSRLGFLLGAIILVPSLAALWTAWLKFNSFVPPSAIPLTITGAGALLVNLVCAVRLSAHHHGRGSLSKAAFLSARNDVFANAAIIAAGITTLFWLSPWPDLIVGLAIALINAGAALEIWQAAHREGKARATP
ncbi:MAG: cation transporter [Parasphingorhabdus sp.]|uniref:cation transporter n=1 Tax=Parasphingorhabdus sp. TaxID=2709688 RepID=UPI0030024C9F